MILNECVSHVHDETILLTPQALASRVISATLSDAHVLAPLCLLHAALYRALSFRLGSEVLTLMRQKILLMKRKNGALSP